MSKMDKFEVNGQLLSMIIDNKYSDRARSFSESFSDLIVKVALVDDTEALFDFARLSHADQSAIISDVNESVLLEDRSQKGVKDY